MVRHIVMWNFKDGLSNEENIQSAQRVKKELESLSSMIQGIISLQVIISVLDSSNRDIVLNSLFESKEALANYQLHPEHVRVSQYVGTVMRNRSCIDYFE